MPGKMKSNLILCTVSRKLTNCNDSYTLFFQQCSSNYPVMLILNIVVGRCKILVLWRQARCPGGSGKIRQDAGGKIRQQYTVVL
jgi:hypothetical protein